MSRSRLLVVVLVLSLAVNLGVLTALIYQWAGPGRGDSSASGLVQYLELRPEQRQGWRDAEASFLDDYERRAREIRARRDQLLHVIFADEPDPARIEAEREGVARLQAEQQQAVIRQLLNERELLDRAQQQRLLRRLLEQPVDSADFESLHRD